MDFNLSSDNKYYASGDVSAITGDRVLKLETPKKVVRKVNPSPGAESTDKYYANEGGQEVVEVLPREAKVAETESISDVSDVGRIIDDVVDAFSIGATEVRVPAVEGLDVKARTNLDLRVGRGELTKDQADSVTFLILNPPPEETEAAPEEDEGLATGEELVATEEADEEADEEVSEAEEETEEEAEEAAEEDGPSIASLFGADDDDGDD
jgi:hypothetical protein